MENFLTWLSYWTTDSVITAWAKAHVLFTGVLIVLARTIADRTKTTIDNEFLGRLKKRFSPPSSE